MKKQLLTGLLTATLCTSAFAAEVTGDTPAVAGETATAAAINARFDAFKSAINDNNARIAELESFDVSGKTYDFKEVSMIVGAETGGNISNAPNPAGDVPAGFARIGQLTTTARMTFSDDGTFSVEGQQNEIESFVNLNVNVGTLDDGPFSETATWTQNGSTVTVTFTDGFTLEFAVSRGATMFTGMVANDTELENTATFIDLDGNERTARLYSVESSLQVGTLVE